MAKITLTLPITSGGGSSSGDFIPLSGTTVGNPVTGDIEFEEANNLMLFSGSEYKRILNFTDESSIKLGLFRTSLNDYSSMFSLGNENIVFRTNNFTNGKNSSIISNPQSIDITADNGLGESSSTIVSVEGVNFSSSSPLAVGFSGTSNFSSNITDLDYTQKIYVDTKEPLKGIDDNYVTDAEKIVLSNTSGTNSGDNATNTQYSGLATSKQDTLTDANFGAFINALTAKTTPTWLDNAAIYDSLDGKAKKTSLTNIKNWVLDGFSSTNKQPLNTIIYESYGDSFTLGQGASFGYVTLFKTLYSLIHTNRAVSGTGIYSALGLHNANTNITSGTPTNKFVSIMAGFNDIGAGGNSAKTIAKIKNGYRGVLVNQFLKTFLSASHAAVTKSGTWSSFPSSTYGGKTTGLSSIVSGNYAQFPFTGDNVAVAMTGIDGSITYGTFDVTIDGVAQGSYTLNNQTDTVGAVIRSPFVLYFSGLADADHVIRVTQTSSDLVNIDYFGVLEQPKFCTPILVNEIPKRNAAGYVGTLATDAITDQLNSEINNVIGEFNSDYPIYHAKTNDYYNTSTGVSVDNIHPNDLGHRQLFMACYDTLKNISLSVLSKSNTFTGVNEFRGITNIGGGIVIRGNAGAVAGSGIEFTGGTSPHMFAYNRAGGGTWIDMVWLALSHSWGSSGAIQMKLTSLGNLLLGTTTDITSSRFTIASTTQGALLPRMTTTQKNAIVSPAEGLEVYDLTLHKKSFYNGTTWEVITSV